MPSTRVIWGPAGTGKTSAGIMLAKMWFSSGVLPDEVAYLAFTRAAAKEAASRIEDTHLGGQWGERFPLFRTLHSLAYRLMKGARPDVGVVSVSDMKRFSAETGLEGAYAVHGWEDLAEAYQGLQDQGRTDWDRCLTAYQLSRLEATDQRGLERASSAMSSLACRIVGPIDLAMYSAFVQKYERFKRQEGLVDFTDMLSYALTSAPPLHRVRYVLVDESQDLSPIMHAIIDRLFPRAEEVWWIGDDFQAIYTFAGASAGLFLSRANQARHQILLRQTHRFGQSIVEFSDKIISRARERMPKEIIGVPGREGPISLTAEFVPRPGESLILHRHVAGCQALAKAHIDAGLPFRNERGRDPLGAKNRVTAWAALDALARRGRARFDDVRLLVEELMPSTTAEDGQRVRLVVYGAKKKMSIMNYPTASLEDLRGLEILTQDGVAVLMERRYRALKHPDDLEYYDRVSRKGHALDGRGAPVITTIHGSKGRQAPRVTVFAEMGRKCWDDPDTEHRLAYVAATRTQSGVEICAQSTVEWALERYDYPVERVES